MIKNKIKKYSVSCLILLGCLILATSCVDKERWLTREGNKLFEEKDYPAASQIYQEILDKYQDAERARYNLANTLYRQGMYDLADTLYGTVPDSALDKEEYLQVVYNQGNAKIQQYLYLDTIIQQMDNQPLTISNFIKKDSLRKRKQLSLKKGIENYKTVLKSNPVDSLARYNLAYAQTFLLKDGGEDQNNENQQYELTPFAKKIKANADSLNRQNDFVSSDQVLKYGLNVDTTLKKINQFINKVDGVAKIDKEQ